MLAAAPGAPEPADFVADVFLRFGLKGEALQILRRASRQNPADKRLALRLTELLVALPEVNFGSQIPNLKSQISNLKSEISNLKFPITPVDEARDVLWRVFEQSAKLDDRVEVVRKLNELAVFPGEFDKLV